MRKSYVFLALFFSGLAGFAGELRIITSGGLQGVANDQGQVVVPAIYEKLGWSNGQSDITSESIGYFENGKWGLINIKTTKLTSARYTTLEPFNNVLFEAGVAGKFTNIIFRGLIDSKSQVHLDFKYYTIDDLGDHRLLVSEYVTGGELRFGVYTDQNERLIAPEYASIDREGNYILARNKARKTRIYNLNGQVVLPVWVDEVKPTSEGLVIINEGYQGFLDHHGKLIHELSYKSVEDLVKFPRWEVKKLNGAEQRFFLCDSLSYDYETDLLIAHVNNAEHMLGASETLFQDQQHGLKYISNGFLVTRNKYIQTWGIYKTDGREVAIGFDSVAVDTDYFYAKSGAAWDVYNLFGRKINDRPFQQVRSSQERHVPVRKNDYWGWVDFQGEQLINYHFEDVIPTTNPGHFMAKNYGRWGVSGFDDEWLIMPQYDSVYAYQSFYLAEIGFATHVYSLGGKLLYELPYTLMPGDFLAVQDSASVGAVTDQGYYIYPEYDEVSRHGEFFELRKGTITGLISGTGRVLLGPKDKVEDVLSYSEGYFHIIKDGKHGFVDENGKLRIANRYDSAQYYHEGLAPIKLLGKWGFVDPAENLVIQPFYRYSSVFDHGLAVIQSGEHFGIINQEGEEVIAPAWKYIERLATGNYRITDWDLKMGLVDANGKFIVRPNYGSIDDTDQALIIAGRSGKKGVLDYSGFTKVPFDYQQIQIVGDYLLLRK